MHAITFNLSGQIGHPKNKIIYKGGNNEEEKTYSSFNLPPLFLVIIWSLKLQKNRKRQTKTEKDDV